ncbi:MAG TPA: hypothetical protein VH477_02965 [Bryobacteraceae bacterium]
MLITSQARGRLSEIPIERAPRLEWICAGAALLVALALTLGYTYTRRPWWDEGLFADVALNFRNSAHLRSSVLAPHSYVDLPAPDRYTYWQFPGYLVALGAWFRLLPVTVYSMRLFSVLWGCAFVAGWFLFVRAFSRKEALALLTAVLVAFDYSVLAAASDGRMDMMCAALGQAALASYACLRESRPARAALLTGFFGAASLFSHPMGAVTNACLLVLVLCDVRRLRARFFALAAIPYLLFGAAFLLYILQAPQLFVAQMKAVGSYRVGGVLFTLASMARDFRDRYLRFYFAPHGGLHRLKLFALLFGALGFAALSLNRRLRANPLATRLLLLLPVCYLGVAALDTMKFPYYLVYVMPVLTACGAVWLYDTFQRHSPARFLASVFAAGFLLANIAPCLYYIRRNDLANEYKPAIAALARIRTPGDIVMGPSELAFDLGFGAPLIDDSTLGYTSGIRPKIYIMSASYGPLPGSYQQWTWSRRVLAESYRPVFTNPAYTIYLRKPE